jgi:hypothetical protein
MNTTLLIAKALGIFLSVFGVSILFHAKRYKEVIENLIENKSSQLIAGIVPTILGGFLVNIHNVWIKNWTVLVTILCWGILIGGIVRLVFPGFWVCKMEKLKDKLPFPVVGIVLIALGLVLSYFGYIA